MKWKKQLPALFLAAVWMVSLLAGCSQEQAAGISLSVCVGSEPVTLDPIYAEESGDQTILVHLYENLMRSRWTPPVKTRSRTELPKASPRKQITTARSPIPSSSAAHLGLTGKPSRPTILYMPGSGWQIPPANPPMPSFCPWW